METRESKGILSAIAGGIGAAISGMLQDGTIAAAGRQGVGEIGQALKAFPDSIQVQEPGTLWNPTQGEIAEARRPEVALPGDIAQDNTPHTPNQEQMQDMSRGR